MANFLFGYHIRVMNGPIVSIARELNFEGNSILEGLVVSIFIAGAFIGSIGSGPLVDKIDCRRTFQIVTLPLILGAFVSAQLTPWMRYYVEDFLLVLVLVSTQFLFLTIFPRSLRRNTGVSLELCARLALVSG